MAHPAVPAARFTATADHCCQLSNGLRLDGDSGDGAVTGARGCRRTGMPTSFAFVAVFISTAKGSSCLPFVAMNPYLKS